MRKERLLTVFMIWLLLGGLSFSLLPVGSKLDPSKSVIPSSLPIPENFDQLDVGPHLTATLPFNEQISQIDTDYSILSFSSMKERDSKLADLLQREIVIKYVFQNIPAITILHDEAKLKDFDGNKIFSSDSSYSIAATEAQEDSLQPLRSLVSGNTLSSSSDWVGINYLWDQGLFGENQTIAIVDSGIDDSLPTFDSETNASESRISTYVVSDLIEEGEEDYSGHGTHVAGIAVGNGIYKIGDNYLRFNDSHGMAPKADVLSVKILDSTGFGRTSGVLEGIDYAISQNVSVISMSFGTDIYNGSDDLHIPLMQKAIDKGIILVAAAGNFGYLGGIYH